MAVRLKDSIKKYPVAKIMVEEKKWFGVKWKGKWMTIAQKYTWQGKTKQFQKDVPRKIKKFRALPAAKKQERREKWDKIRREYAEDSASLEPGRKEEENRFARCVEKRRGMFFLRIARGGLSNQSNNDTNDETKDETNAIHYYGSGAESSTSDLNLLSGCESGEEYVLVKVKEELTDFEALGQEMLSSCQSVKVVEVKDEPPDFEALSHEMSSSYQSGEVIAVKEEPTDFSEGHLRFFDAVQAVPGNSISLEHVETQVKYARVEEQNVGPAVFYPEFCNETKEDLDNMNLQMLDEFMGEVKAEMDLNVELEALITRGQELITSSDENVRMTMRQSVEQLSAGMFKDDPTGLLEYVERMVAGLEFLT